MSGIGVIMNPHSRSNRRNPERIRRLAFIVGDKGSCHATQDVLDLRQVAQEFLDRGVEVIGISGGDGTIHHTLSAFMDIYGDQPLPKVALLRGGTVNNIANAIGIQGTPESILSRLILKYHEDEAYQTTPVHCLDVNGVHGFLFGNGLATNFISEYIRRGEGGAYNVLYLIARAVVSALIQGRFMCRIARRYDARVLLDGEEWPYKNYVGLMAGTVEPFGFGIRPFYRARERPGHFHVLGMSMPPRMITGDFFRIWCGLRRRSEHFLEKIAREVVIELKEPLPFMVDGELHPATDRIVVKCGPALTMITQ